MLFTSEEFLSDPAFTIVFCRSEKSDRLLQMKNMTCIFHCSFYIMRDHHNRDI